eukprot:6060000-Pleurochrysis_carterae.AAC.2
MTTGHRCAISEEADQAHDKDVGNLLAGFGKKGRVELRHPQIWPWFLTGSMQNNGLSPRGEALAYELDGADCRNRGSSYAGKNPLVSSNRGCGMAVERLSVPSGWRLQASSQALRAHTSLAMKVRQGRPGLRCEAPEEAERALMPHDGGHAAEEARVGALGTRHDHRARVGRGARRHGHSEASDDARCDSPAKHQRARLEHPLWCSLLQKLCGIHRLAAALE